MRRPLLVLLAFAFLSSSLLLAAPHAEAAKPAEAEAPTGVYGNQHPLLSDWSFGVNATLLGAPNPFRLGGEVKYNGLLSLAFDYGLLPAWFSANSTTIGFNGWMASANVYPFQRAFYLGLGVGRQTYSATQQGTISGTVTNVTANINLTVLVPHLGWHWIWDSGFSFGMELGAQVPLSSGATLSSDQPSLSSDPTFQELQADVNSESASFKNITMPLLGLLQFGYYF